MVKMAILMLCCLFVCLFLPHTHKHSSMANTIVSYLRTNSVQVVWFLSESPWLVGVPFSERFYGLLDPDCQVKVSWWPLSSISMVGPSLSFSLLCFLWRENVNYRRGVLLKLVCFVCFRFSSRVACQLLNEGVPRGWPSDPAAPALFTHPQALLVLRQLHYLGPLQKPGAAGCSLICNPESEPAGLRQEEARPVISRASVLLPCSAFLGPGLTQKKIQPPGQDSRVVNR